MNLIKQYLKLSKKPLIGALFLATINQVFSLLDPQIFRMIIDNYATRFDELTRQEFISGILWLTAAAVGVALVSRTAKTFQDYYVNVVTERLGARLYAHSVDHTFSLSYEVYEDQRSGETLLKLEKARDDAKKLVASIINVLFLSLVGIIFVLSYAFYVHWSVGLLYVSIIPLLGFTTYLVSRKIKQAQETIVKRQADLAGATTETLRNVQLVKSLGLEEQEIMRLNNVNEQVLQLELTKVKLIRRLSFIQGTLVNALRSTLTVLMLWLVFEQLMSLGEFFSLLFYSFFVFAPLQEFGTLATNYREAQASMKQLQDILDKPIQEQPEHAVTIDRLNTISFDGVGLQYTSAEDPSVQDITFDIRAGQTVAFVGPSGAGKSTLVKMLAGLYYPTSGKLTFNAHDVYDIDFVALRRRIGLVAQETQLFSGTIMENLLFVKPDATKAECEEAIAAAAAQSIIDRGTKGLDTIIGEGGIKLSGGERQRLAIARALLRQPELLIFDEATSSLDSLTEEAITKTVKDIEQRYPDLIRVLVAHRLSTIMHADVIFVLEQGRLVEQGSHDDLLSKQGLYAAMWRQQSGE